MLNLKNSSSLSDTKVEAWGYNFVGSAVDNLLRDLESPSAPASYSDFRERRERANELMFELVGQEPRLFYVRRKGSGREVGEEIWELTLATDENQAKLPKRLEELQKTFGLVAAVPKDGVSGLKLLSTRLLPPFRGGADGFAVACRVRLLPNHHDNIGLPKAAWKRVSSLPICSDCVPTEDQLQVWKAFLDVERRIAEARQFEVQFVGHNYGVGTRRIILEIDAASATLDGSPENPLKENDFWQRAKGAKHEDIKLIEPGLGRYGRNSRQLGLIEDVDPKSAIIRVKLERELGDYMAQGGYRLPAQGSLVFEARGEIAQIERKKKALEDLKKGSTQNPYLGLFFFDVSQARERQKKVQLQAQDLLLPAANPDQMAAVAAVLAAPDLVLIQGPPGTGKTTVIAEICYQVAHRGGRTLIASQANLAVDNALSRLVHNPVIRAVRRGKAEKVGEEGLPFLEEQVISTWLQNTSTDCEKNLAQRQENVQVFQQLLAGAVQFTAYLKAEEEFFASEQEFNHQRTVLEAVVKEQATVYGEATSNQGEVESLNTELAVLLSSAAINWQDADVVSLLSRLQPYGNGEAVVQGFIDNVKTAIVLAAELGQVIPSGCGAFSLTAWLHDTVAPWLTDTQTALADAHEAVIAITTTESATQSCTQLSESLVPLQETYRDVIVHQQSLQLKIEKLKSRQSQINPAMIELEAWLLTAHAPVYDVLKTCLQGRRSFTPDLMPLPPSFLALTQGANSIPWQESLAQCQVKIDELIHTYREYDKLHQAVRELEQLLPLQKSLDEAEVLREMAKWDRGETENNPKSSTSLKKLEQLAHSALEQKHQLAIEVVRRQVVALRQRAQPIHFAPALREIATEIVQSIATSARQVLSQIQVQTEQGQQSVQEQLSKLEKQVAEQEMVIATTQEQIATAHHEADLKFNSAIVHLEKLAQLPQTPDKFRALVQQYLQTPANILAQLPQFSAKVNSWESRTKQLETFISSLDALAVLSTLKNILSIRLAHFQELTESSQKQLQEAQNQLSELDRQQPQPSESLLTKRTWWQETFLAIPERLKPKVTATSITTVDVLHQMQERFDAWQQELVQEEAYLSRYQQLISDWISRIRNPAEQDHNELKQIYLDNANVIGITCVQAAGRDFSEEFKAFDVVIIDEVSKCTPPELLIPALKGKKLVMVGDHRQLPPMLDTNTLEEVAETIGSKREEIQFLEESLFKSQFEAADKSIKQMLTIQYRMHPQIMAAINQFYDGKLQCGILEPETKRAHNLAGPIIQEQHHLMWVTTPEGQGFEEQREGTSLFNMGEVEIIECLCQQMESVWAAKVSGGKPKKEIAVITFYGAQLRKIDERLDSELFPSLAIRTGTVDRFQGMERPVVIVSMVRNNSERDIGFAKKPERVNVAFSRAQELLIIVGCHSLFTNARGVGSIYTNVSEVVQLHNGFVEASEILGE